MSKPQKVLSLFAITMITIAGIYNVRNLPILAKYGFTSTFFLILAVVVYFIPIALCCAELAAAWPKRGGVYAWVSEAFGTDMGFLAIWLEWINTVVSFPMNLIFISGTFAYIFMPNLAHDKMYMFLMTLGIFWAITIVNFLGIKVSSWVSAVGLILGTLLPTVLIIILGLIWWLGGHPIQIHFTPKSFMPDLNLHSTVLLISIILGYAGMQVAAFHIHEFKNPQRDFPRAVLWSALVIIAATIFGTLAIAIVVPSHSIGIVTGIMQAMSVFLGAYHLKWLVPFIAFLIVVGAGASLNTWLIAPCKGLHAAVSEGHLPKILKRTNDQGVPTAILLLQAIIATLLTSVFLFMPTVSSSYWLLTALTAICTFFMDILIFSSVLRLRKTQADTHRPYRIPGNRATLYIITGMGIISCLIGICLGFLPPAQLKTGSAHFYTVFVVGGLIVLITPALFMRFKSKKNKQ